MTNQYTNPWTKQETEFLKENYLKSPKTEILLSLPNRSWIGIKQKSCKERIKRETQAPHHTLNNKTISILVGSLLGDAGLRIDIKKGSKNAVLSESHKIYHKDYKMWTAKFINIIGFRYTKIK